MERLIWVTWRAFWVGLGASLVLIAQALAPSGATQAPAVQANVEAASTASSDAPACQGAAGSKSADPILSRNPFDSKTGPLIRTPAKRPRGA